MEQLFEVLTPYVGEIAVLLIAVVGVFVIIRVAEAVRGNQEASRLFNEWRWLIEAAGNIVVRVAFHITPEELVLYEEEAMLTGRDVRLVTAYHELQQLAEERGITLDLSQAVGLIERIYQDYINRTDNSPLANAPTLAELEQSAFPTE